MSLNSRLSEKYIGLLSGTSADGIDACLIDLKDTPTLLAAHTTPYPSAIKNILKALPLHKHIALEQLSTLDSQLGHLFAETALALLEKTTLQAADVRAIGSHGQTIFHYPFGQYRSSIQIGDPNIIAERTQITTVADFRRRDLALQGQGAPLVPTFHHALFASGTEARAIVNIGGIANVTYLPNTDGNIIGFDTGPGNTLLDAWMMQHKQLPFDAGGAFAASGKVHLGLVDQWLLDAYFLAAPPKSTGPEQFNLAWAKEIAGEFWQTLPPEDLQASLLELTAQSITRSIQRFCHPCDRVILCGGGVHNLTLQQRLRLLLAPMPVNVSNDFGIDADHVESMAFAWLAKQTLAGKPGNLPSVTGASRAAILGAIYKY